MAQFIFEEFQYIIPDYKLKKMNEVDLVKLRKKLQVEYKHT